MFLLATAAAIVANAHVNSAPPPAVAQATATVRIVSGVQLKLDSVENADAPRAHDSIVSADGTPHHARLIEFE